MKIKFYLKRPDSKTPTSLFALINYNGNTLKVYTSESIIPRYWNQKSQEAIKHAGFTERPEFNYRIDLIRSTINRVFLEYRNKNEHAAPSPAILKPMLEVALKKRVVKTTFLDYFEDFVKRTFAGQRIDPRTKKRVSHDVAKGYQTTLNHLKEFNKRRRIDFDNIDLVFHREFTDFLSSVPRLLSANTIGINFQRIKAVMAEATEMGINKNMTFKSKNFIKQSEDADTIYLSSSELKELEAHNLSGIERLDNVRDLFLIACYTGLRFSDFSILTPDSISNGYIKITQTKTGDPVTIPVHDEVKKIMDKRSGKLPPAITNQKMNEYLKEIGRRLDCLSGTVTKSITKGGLRVTNVIKKCELLTTHTARRSFATNEYMAGTPTLIIMAITGHRTEAAFRKYIRVTPDEQAQKMKDIWDERRKNLKAV